MEEQNVFQDLPIGKLVCKMAVPIIITMIIQALYNVVDSLFVAQLGIKPLSALGIAYPIQMIMIMECIHNHGTNWTEKYATAAKIRSQTWRYRGN